MQAHATIPDDAWEYHIRKSLNDAAYKGLDYVPYCSTMPLKPESESVRFIWVRGADDGDDFGLVQSAPCQCAF